MQRCIAARDRRDCTSYSLKASSGSCIDLSPICESTHHPVVILYHSLQCSVKRKSSFLCYVRIELLVQHCLPATYLVFLFLASKSGKAPCATSLALPHRRVAATMEIIDAAMTFHHLTVKHLMVLSTQ